MTLTDVRTEPVRSFTDDRFKDLDGSVRDFGFRASGPVDQEGILEGYAAVFNQQTRIANWEGDFTEVIRKGAFAKAVRGSKPKIMFEHGKHPFIGTMPIAELVTLREDDHGLFVRANMFRNVFTEGIIDAINGNAVDDMSFRFIVPEGGDEWSTDRQTRTLVRDLEVPEFGPVVFGAYSGTSVGLRTRQFYDALQDDDVRRDLSLAFILDPTSLDSESVRDESPADNETEDTADRSETPADEAGHDETSAPNAATVLALSLEVRAAQAAARSKIEPPDVPID